MLTAVIASAFVAALLLAVAGDFSDAETSGDCGEHLAWSLDGTDLTITGYGEMYQTYSSTGPWGTGITSVTFINEPGTEGITLIGHYAFYGCSGLTSLTIPESVTAIGAFAFAGCTLNTIYCNTPDFKRGIECWAYDDTLFIQANGGYITGGAMDTEVKEFPSAEQFVPPAGMTFKEYNTKPDGTGRSYSPGDPYTLSGFYCLYAIWSADQYTLTFEQEHGPLLRPQTVDYGSSVTEPPVAEVRGYVFCGWYKEPECINEWDFEHDVITGDTTLYAKWVAGEDDDTDILVPDDRPHYVRPHQYCGTGIAYSTGGV